MRELVTGVALAAVTFGLVFPQVAKAQSNEDQENPSLQAQGENGGSDKYDSYLNEIIVTATKREQSLNDVPMSISASTGEQLQQLGINSVEGLTKAVPGFNAVDSSYGSPVYYLRGIGYFDTTLLAKATVGVYVDEVPLPFSVMTQGASFDLARVEVLKGPQGTLFGSNATGGAINYVVAKPTDELQAGVNGSFGRFAAADLTAYVSGPISDALRARLAIRHEMRGDWQQSLTSDKTLGQRNFTQGRFQLEFEPTETFVANLMVSGFIDKSDTQAPQFQSPFQQTVSRPLDPRLITYPIADDNARQADWGDSYKPVKDNKMLQTSLRMDLEASDSLTLTSLSAYSYYNQKQGFDADGTNLQLSDLYLVGKIDSYFQELRGSLELENGSVITVGVNYEKSKGPETTNQRLADQTSAKVFVGLGFGVADYVPQVSYLDYESKAAFGNIDYNVSDQITLHAGARYTETTSDFEACNLDGSASYAYARGIAFIFSLAPPPQGECVTLVRQADGTVGFGKFQNKLEEDNIAWRFGIDFEPSSNHLVYANVSRGFKAGSFSNLPASDATQLRPVTQERLTAYEIGFKSSLADQKIQINGAGFYYDYSDKQLKGRTNVPVFNFLEALVNVPKSRVYGAELQGTVYPISGLRLNAAATYLDTKITSDFTNFSVFGEQINFKGREFSNTPNWQINADANYEFILNEDVDAYIGSSMTYRSSTYGDFKPDARIAIKSYTLVDLRAGIRSAEDNWHFGVYGRNITDTYYWTSAVRRGDTVVRFAGMPATYGIEFGFEF